MKATKLINAYINYITSEDDYKAEAKKLCNKQGYLPDVVVEALAEAHATYYGIKYKRTIYYKQTSSKAWVFYTNEACTKADKDTTTTKQWERTIEPFHNITKRKANVMKQVDKVAKRAKAIKAEFTKAEIKRFIKLLQTEEV